MSFLKNLLSIRDIKGPEFYKDFEKNNKQLYELEELAAKVKSNKKKIIERDILNLKIGLEGERAVSYELKNSFIPMICLHDIRIDNAGYVAQMDYILITEKFIMVLETKKLNGDIVINEAGEFIRRFKTKNGKVYKNEGMYSPIAQNDRHVRILDNFLKGNGIIKNIPIYSAVIIANQKAIINRSKAPYHIKNSIFKHDQITEMLRKKLKASSDQAAIFESQMINIANFLINSNRETSYDFYGKYGITDEDLKEKELIEDEQEAILEDEIVEEVETTLEEPKICKEAPVENIEAPIVEKEEEVTEDVNPLYEGLKAYRLKKSREENVKAYFIFNNKTLDELVSKKPKSREELIKIQGFGEVKANKYGEGILEIINNS